MNWRKKEEKISEKPLPIATELADKFEEYVLMIPVDDYTARYQKEAMKSRDIKRCNRCLRVAKAPFGAIDCPFCCGQLLL
jgi:hypothetical protein